MRVGNPTGRVKPVNHYGVAIIPDMGIYKSVN